MLKEIVTVYMWISTFKPILFTDGVYSNIIQEWQCITLSSISSHTKCYKYITFHITISPRVKILGAYQDIYVSFLPVNIMILTYFLRGLTGNSKETRSFVGNWILISPKKSYEAFCLSSLLNKVTKGHSSHRRQPISQI